MLSVAVPETHLPSRSTVVPAPPKSTTVVSSSSHNAAGPVQPFYCQCGCHDQIAETKTELILAQRKLKTLEASIATTKKQLQKSLEELESRGSFFSPKNVKRREQRTKTKINLLQQQNKSLTRKSKQTIQGLENKLHDLLEQNLKAEKEKVKAQKLKSYYKQNRICSTDGEQKVQIKTLCKEIAAVENAIEISKENKANLELKDQSGQYSDQVRTTVLELLRLEVASDKVGPVLGVVARHLFHCPLTPSQLPTRQTVVNISDEGQYLVKKYLSEQLYKTQFWGINKDGTQRKKVKIMDTAVTLHSGEVVPLGFRKVAHETSAEISTHTQKELEELGAIHLQSETPDAEEDGRHSFLCSVLNKLSFMMSDRAANEKAANRMLC